MLLHIFVAFLDSTRRIYEEKNKQNMSGVCFMSVSRVLPVSRALVPVPSVETGTMDVITPDECDVIETLVDMYYNDAQYE